MVRAGPNHAGAKLQAIQDTARAEKRQYTRLEPYRGAMMNALTAALVKLGGSDTDALMAATVQTFKQQRPDVVDIDYRYLAKDVYNRMLNKDNLEDEKRSGRPQVLTDDVVDEAIDELTGGYYVKDPATGEMKWMGYTSLAHAKYKSDKMRRIIARANVKEDTLRRRMDERHIEKHGVPMNKISITFKVRLSDEVKQERLACAHEWSKRGVNWLKKVVWIDEKQEYLKAGCTVRVFAPVKWKSFQREDTQELEKAEKFKYEAAVSAFCGPIYFNAITGTTGLPLQYKVRVLIFRYLGTCSTCRAHLD